MPAGFIRRWSYDPGVSALSQIEGVNVIDLAQPSPIQGEGTGFACLVGEFQDMTYACKVAVSGNVVTISTKTRPVEVFSSQDLADKGGGFDETLGEFGGDCGSGFVELRSKKFARLAIAPINLTSPKGARFWRELPTCTSASDPSPVVPMQSASVSAGREFKRTASTTARLRVAKMLSFLGTVDYLRGTDGSVVNAAVSATNPFTSAGSDFVTAGAAKGDILVLGALSGAGAIANNAGTFRVVSVDSATQLTIEKLDGSTFTFTTNAVMPWRLHVGEVADTGPNNSYTEGAGYIVPVRPLTDNTGSTSVGTAWAASSALAPVVAPTAQSSTVAWDPLSGLTGAITPEAGGMTVDLNVQKANAPNHASIDTLYGLAFDSLLAETSPASEINIVWPARKPNASVYGIHAKVKSHCVDASARGRGRTGMVSPSLDIQTLTAVVGTVEPGVGAVRHERLNYDWPGFRVSVPEAQNFSIACADGTVTTDGILDTTSDGWLVVIRSNLAPERNPGQIAEPVPSLLAPILGLQRGAPDLDMYSYITLRQYGVCAPRIDDSDICFQSGITTSLTVGEKNINRRAMADFVEDSLSRGLLPFCKLPLTTELKDGAIAQCETFLDGLYSPNNPSGQRIDGYLVDGKGGNTPALTALGFFVIIVKVRTTPTADFLVLRAQVGEFVDVPQITQVA